MTPKGQMSSNGSGPAIMMMKPHIRATFMPDPPLRYLPPPRKGGSSRGSCHSGKTKKTIATNIKSEIKNLNGNLNSNDLSGKIKLENETSRHPDKNVDTSDGLKSKNEYHKTSSLAGVSELMIQFERSKPPKRKLGNTPASAKAAKLQRKTNQNKVKLSPLIEEYRKMQKENAGEWDGMNCYNTLFVGRLAYETTERKLLREFEAFGPVKDLKLIVKRVPNASISNNGSMVSSALTSSSGDESRGYAFVEFENEEDMKRAYRGGDGMRLDGREIVVDVERGHTV